MQEQRNLNAAQAALESYSPLIDQISLLESSLAQARGRIEQIQASYANVQLDGIAWSELLTRIMRSVPADSRVAYISQAENMVVVSGLSEDYQSALEMAQDLQQSGFFTLVSVDAISSIAIEELVEPTPSADSEADEVVDGESEPEYRFAFSLSLTVPGLSEELE
jgi:Tfp pilus assembly protein PilN